MSCYRAFSLVYLVRVLWHGLDDTTIVESCGLVKCLHLFPWTEVTKYSGKMHEIFKEQKFVFYWCAFPNFGKESVQFPAQNR